VASVNSGKDALQSLDDAKTFAKSGNVAAVEQALTQSSAFKTNSTEWHLETTQKLIQTAHELARDGNSSSVNAIALQSLQHLDQVALTAKNANDKSRAKATAGFVYERFIGDPTSAIASYKAAVQLNPNDKASQEALQRLQDADANLRAKIHPPKGK
jgi:hypothetical protein